MRASPAVETALSTRERCAQAEADLFARYVLPKLNHAPLRF